MIPYAKLWLFLRKTGPVIAIEAAVNFVLPFLIYNDLKPGFGEFDALLASSAPPIVWSVIQFARARKIDAVSMLVIAGIVLSAAAALGGGSVKFLQLREKLVTVIIGLAFLFSAAIGKPLMYYLARASMRRSASPELSDFEARRDDARFKRAMTVMTLVWGVGLVAEAAFSGWLVFLLSVHDYLLVGPVVGYATTGALALWTVWYVRRRQRQRRQGLAAARPGLAPPVA